MASNTTTPTPVPEDKPLDNFSHCHDGIIKNLKTMDSLPQLAAAADQARLVADGVRNFFRDVIYNHHEEEERLLFEAVLASATEGEEHARVKAITDQLTREHRQVEAMFAKLEPELKKMAKGQVCHLEAAQIDKLVSQYRAHAVFEETEFLPLSQQILSRNSNHMAALGLSLHIRHVSVAPSAT
ncbi:MAG TPA: hemerythrin domain-containing protein [Rhodoferax sp.]|jgi:hemerythrin-like domain-containing protein|nr:hemerythrin domain-containing protein [Rhodoferax sp.]